MPWYLACPNTSCSKKVEEGSTLCNSCSTTFEAPNPRFIQSMAVSNRDGKVYINIYDDAFANFMNMSCAN